MCSLNELATAVANAQVCVSVFPNVEHRRQSLQAAAQSASNVGRASRSEGRSEF
jgi:hypothetical protein